jgi:5'-nucleotidase
VDGIGIIQSFSAGQAFGRVDVLVDRETRKIARIQLFPPRTICAHQDPVTGNCVPTTESSVPAKYEGRVVSPDPAIVQAMAPALQRVHALQATTIGVSLDAPIRRAGDLGSPLGNLFAEALRHAAGADVAAVNNAARGLRADIPEGPITFGRLYDVFPFDNRIVRITLSGAELARWVAGEIRQGRRAGLGMAGVGVRAKCVADGIQVELLRPSGRPIHDEERLVAVTIGAPTLSGSLASPAPLGGVGPTENAPVAREVFEDWFRRLARLSQAERDDAIRRRPGNPDAHTADCVAVNALGGSPNRTAP